MGTESAVRSLAVHGLPFLQGWSSSDPTPTLRTFLPPSPHHNPLLPWPGSCDFSEGVKVPRPTRPAVPTVPGHSCPSLVQSLGCPICKTGLLIVLAGCQEGGMRGNAVGLGKHWLQWSWPGHLSQRPPCPSFELWNLMGSMASLQMCFICLKVTHQHLKIGKFPIKHLYLK